MARALSKNSRSGARGSNGDDGAVRAWSGGERARERERERERARRRARSGGGNGECAGAVHGWRGRSWRWRARKPATRRRWPHTVGRACESPSLVLVINDTKLLMPCVQVI